MIHEEKKTAKIVEELTIFFFALDATYINTHIEKMSHQTIIFMESNFNPAYADKLTHLNHYLNEPKNDSMEDIYWELAGSGEPGDSSQLLLVGMMIDKAEITIEPNLVKMKLYRSHSIPPL